MRAENPTAMGRTMAASDTSGLRRSPGGGLGGGGGTSLTAEIPAVPAGPSYGVLLPDGTIWYPGSRKKLPAPLLLRIVVWTLAFLVLLAAAGDFIIHTHPGWVDPLRRTVPAASGVLDVHVPRPTAGTSGTSGNGGSGGTPSTTSSALRQANPQPANLPAATTAYTIAGVTSYQIVVKAAQATFVQINPLVNGVVGGAPLYQGTLQGGQTQTVPATGSTELYVGYPGTTVQISANGKTIGAASVPATAPWRFVFQPAG